MSNDFFEKTLEQIIIENPIAVHKRGFPFLHDNTVSQFVLPSGGKIDILSFVIDESKESISCKIFELKRDVINVDALCQVGRYASEFYELCCPHFKHVNIERFVVGTDYSKDVITLMECQISIELYLYKYTIDGVLFKKSETIWESTHPEIQKELYSTSEESLALLGKLWCINNHTMKNKKN